MGDIAPEWPTDAVVLHFKEEIHTRFEAENARWRKMETDQLRKAQESKEPWLLDYEVRDSHLWETYQASEIRNEQNLITIVLPQQRRIGNDFLQLVDHTAMGWGRPVLSAVLVDGEPRPAIEILLVATWTDEMDDKEKRTGKRRRRIGIEMYEDDARALETLLAEESEITGVEEKAAFLNGIRHELKAALLDWDTWTF